MLIRNFKMLIKLCVLLVMNDATSLPLVINKKERPCIGCLCLPVIKSNVSRSDANQIFANRIDITFDG